MDGSVYKFFEYDMYRFCDLEVVDNTLYAAEAFAPRVYRADPDTGSLKVVIDDWSLYYFYCLAYDDEFFYVDEWNFRRYDLGGKFKGSASYDGTIYGAAWDGQHLWTHDDDRLIKCWDISTWPSMDEVSSNQFAPPSRDCRGLWFDGEYFWTAESLEEAPGKIYCFDYNGAVVDEWPEPAYSGRGVCTLYVKT